MQVAGRGKIGDSFEFLGVTTAEAFVDGGLQCSIVISIVYSVDLVVVVVVVVCDSIIVILIYTYKYIVKRSN